jgi:hypothetical protein
MTFVDVVASLHSPRPGCIACNACIARNDRIARIAAIARNDCNNCNDEETLNDATTYSVLRTRHRWPGFRDRSVSFPNIIPNWDTPSGTFCPNWDPLPLSAFSLTAYDSCRSRRGRSNDSGTLAPLSFRMFDCHYPFIPSRPSVCPARPDVCPHRGRAWASKPGLCDTNGNTFHSRHQ